MDKKKSWDIQNKKQKQETNFRVDHSGQKDTMYKAFPVQIYSGDSIKSRNEPKPTRKERLTDQLFKSQSTITNDLLKNEDQVDGDEGPETNKPESHYLTMKRHLQHQPHLRFEGEMWIIPIFF